VNDVFHLELLAKKPNKVLLLLLSVLLLLLLLLVRVPQFRGVKLGLHEASFYRTALWHTALCRTSFQDLHDMRSANSAMQYILMKEDNTKANEKKNSSEVPCLS